ncbi:MAG: undecaprenyl-diphosphate phosphatase [Thermoguttaceae bacterium]
MDWLTSAMLGLVEGLTEYIPVSSTGHLKLAGQLSGFEQQVGKQVADCFEVFIQLGAIVAVLVAYPGRFLGLLRLADNRGFSGLRGIGLLLLTTIPAGVFGLAAHGLIKAHLFDLLPVAVGLAAGAVWILLVERFPPRVRTDKLDGISPKQALAIGLFQCLAMLPPGMSRSAATILGGMMVGLGRKAATEYSFFAAVPILFAAGLYDLYKNAEVLQARHVAIFAIGFAVSFLSAWAAVRFLLRFVSHHSLSVFGWYRLAVAGVVLGVLYG